MSIPERSPDSGTAAGTRFWTVLDWALCVLVFAAAVGAFFHARAGQFVYDDAHQIVANPLIQHNDLIGKALTTDVWSFKRDPRRSAPKLDSEPQGTEESGASSAYYRPAFVLHLIWQHRVFGLESAKGWHVINVLLHALASVLCFVVLRRVGGPLPRELALAGAVIFAVHPVHAESVTWISGSPDILVALGMLPAMAAAWILARPRNKPAGSSMARALAWCVLLAGVGLSVTSKEIGIAAAPVLTIVAWESRRQWELDAAAGSNPSARTLERRASWARPALRSAFVIAAPAFAIAAAYLLVRASIVSGRSTPNLGVEPQAVVYTLPSLGAFYLREMLWPFESLFHIGAGQGPGGVGPTHPIRPVNTLALDAAEKWRVLWAPLLICFLGGGVSLWIAWRSAAARIGLVLLVCTLAPALYIRALPPDHIARDRYLYLPLLGLILILLAGLSRFLPFLGSRRGASNGSTGGQSTGFGVPAPLVAAACLFIACVPLTIKTQDAGAAWLTETALWDASLRHDPRSVAALNEVARMSCSGDKATDRASLQRAVEMYSRAIAIRPIVASLSGRANAYLKLAALDLSAPSRDTSSAKIHAELAEADARSALGTLGVLSPDGSLPSDADARSKSGDELTMQILDHLAVSLQRQGKTMPPRPDARADESALGVLMLSRTVRPAASARITAKMAVILYLANQKQAARSELEAALPAARAEFSPQSKLVLHRLGMLLGEGPAPTPPDPVRGIELLKEFMAATNTPEALQDTEVVAARGDAQRVLDRASKLRPGAP